jgi:hypothetical protein
LNLEGYASQENAMLTIPRTDTDMQEVTKHHPALANPAVARCVAAWVNVLETPRRRGESIRSAKEKASRAYRHALPELMCYGNILHFIACVSYGLAIDAIDKKTGNVLIYAARTALSAIPKGAIDMHGYYRDLYRDPRAIRPIH